VAAYIINSTTQVHKKTTFTTFGERMENTKGKRYKGWEVDNKKLAQG
jgi:hypothetical protein